MPKANKAVGNYGPLKKVKTMYPFISVVINADTRPGCKDAESAQQQMFEGTRSSDFLTSGVYNKWRFFHAAGVPFEVILFVDDHTGMNKDVVSLYEAGAIDRLVFSRHDKRFNGHAMFGKFNDVNYLQALAMARGTHIAHFDGDMALFARDPCATLRDWLALLASYNFVSYNTPFSPLADPDPAWDYQWASTRFFICPRTVLDLDEIYKCLQDDDYLYGKYGEKYRRCPWLEHILGIVAGGVYYPPMAYSDYMVFSWSHYQRGILADLNGKAYDDVLAYVKQCGGIGYPCDVHGVKV